jgi:hypothetical protein
VDRVLDEVKQAIREGVREMACRLNRTATSFQQASDNLARAAHLDIGKETLRQLVEQDYLDSSRVWNLYWTTLDPERS